MSCVKTKGKRLNKWPLRVFRVVFFFFVNNYNFNTKKVASVRVTLPTPFFNVHDRLTLFEEDVYNERLKTTF